MFNTPLKPSFVIFLIAATIIILLILCSISYSKTDRLISCETQQGDIKYANAPFCVRLLTKNYLLHKETFLFITAGEDNSYGTYIRYPEEAVLEKEIKTEWHSDGLNVTTPLGYMIHVPKEIYESGR